MPSDGSSDSGEDLQDIVSTPSHLLRQSTDSEEVYGASSGNKWGEQPLVRVPGTPNDVDLSQIELLLPAQIFHPDPRKRRSPAMSTPVDDRYREAILEAARRLAARCGCKGPKLVMLPGWEDGFDVWQGMLADDQVPGF